MDKEEFLDSLNNFLESIRLSKEIETEFKNKLAFRLYTFVFDFYPSFKDVEKSVYQDFNALCQQCASDALSALSSAEYNEEKQMLYQNKNNAPKIKTKEESQKELDDLIKQLTTSDAVISKDDLEYLEKIHWSDYENEVKVQAFHKGLHDIAKATLVDFYEENIQGLESDYLRLLDGYTYLLAIYPFIDEVYTIFPTPK